MNKKDVKLGDVVELNSGGPNMTVLVKHPHHVQVTWLDDDFKPQTDIFLYECVTKVTWETYNK